MPQNAVRLALLIGAMALGSCEHAGSLAGGGPRSDYLVARQALETGNYALAIERYAALIAGQPPGVAQRLELEHAHALLRADRHDQAIAAADALAGVSDGAIRASAQAVRGTARHEAARARTDRGERGADTRALLEAARTDLAAFLASHDALDSAGAMRTRLDLIAADLRSL